MPARVIAVANQKGGVGKTTTAVNLAAGIALTDRRTLLVDLDPQGNATTGLGIAAASAAANAYTVVLGESTVSDAALETSIPSLTAISGGMDLVGAEIELVGQPSREAKLKEALRGSRDEFSYIVIDCPPSLGLLTLNALTAAGSVLIPVQCEYYAMEGLAQLLRTIDLVKQQLNPDLQVEGLLLTMFDGRTSMATQVRAEIERHFGRQIFKTVIPRNVRLTEAPSHGKPIFLYDMRSPGSVAYLELTAEVLANG